jgi:hypothetical protein
MSNNRRFKHGNNIIFTQGEHKGRHGYVREQDYRPGLMEVEINDDFPIVLQENVRVGDLVNYPGYGSGNVIQTENRNTIYDVFVNNRIERFLERETLNVVVYEKDGKLCLGKKLSTDGDKVIIQPISKLCFTPNSILDDMNELFQMLAVRIRDNSVTLENQITVSPNSVQRNVIFVTQRDSSHFGQYGNLLNQINTPFAVRVVKRVKIHDRNAVRTEDGSLTIRTGPYAGRRFRIVQRNVPSISVYVGVLQRMISSHRVDNRSRQIVPSDVFYEDLVLTNGNSFEVRKVTGNTIEGRERVGNNYVERTISRSEIQRTDQGFQFLDSVEDAGDTFRFANVPSEEEEEDYLVSDEQEQDDRDENEIDDERNETFDEPETDSNENQYAVTHRDFERTARERRQQEGGPVTGTLKRILGNLNIPVSIVTPEFVLDIEGAIQRVKQVLQTTEEFRDTAIGPDDTYILVCILFSRIISNGHSALLGDNVDWMISYYITELIADNELTNSNAAHSLFITPGWTDAFTIDETRVGDLQRRIRSTNKRVQTPAVQPLNEIIFRNCYALLRTFDELQLVDLEGLNQQLGPQSSDADRIVAVTGRSQYPTTTITIGEVLRTGEIPSTATSIVWGQEYLPLLQTFRHGLQSLHESRSTYRFITTNLEQAPIVLRTLSRQLRQMGRDSPEYSDMHRNFTDLQSVWLLLIKRVMVVYNDIQESKKRKRDDIQERTENAKQKRKGAMDARQMREGLELLGISSKTSSQSSVKTDDSTEQQEEPNKPSKYYLRIMNKQNEQVGEMKFKTRDKHEKSQKTNHVVKKIDRMNEEKKNKQQSKGKEPERRAQKDPRWFADSTKKQRTKQNLFFQQDNAGSLDSGFRDIGYLKPVDSQSKGPYLLFKLQSRPRRDNTWEYRVQAFDAELIPQYISLPITSNVLRERDQVQVPTLGTFTVHLTPAPVSQASSSWDSAFRYVGDLEPVTLEPNEFNLTYKLQRRRRRDNMLEYRVEIYDMNLNTRYVLLPPTSVELQNGEKITVPASGVFKVRLHKA